MNKVITKALIAAYRELEKEFMDSCDYCICNAGEVLSGDWEGKNLHEQMRYVLNQLEIYLVPGYCPRVYISVHEAIGGWMPIVVERGKGPLSCHLFKFRTKEEAILAARNWGTDEEIPCMI